MTEAAYPPRRAVAAWVMFDWSTQPFFTLVTTFIFAPFFAAAIAASPEEGQALWGYATAAAGLCIAAFSPVLGSIADQAGGRKPWIAAFGCLLVAGSGLLWLAAPGTPHAWAYALAGYAIALVGAEFATVFNNAMMPGLVPPEQIGRLSGTGWAVGYLGGLVSLGLTLALLASNPETGKTLAGLSPILGLDGLARDGDRFTGPLAAIWFAVFVTPMFALVPDRPRRMALGPAIGSGLGRLKATILSLGGRRDLALFLLANMIYADALVALFAFGGIYAAGAFGWGSIEIGVFGVLLTVTGAIGAFAGGRLDDRVGSRAVIAASLVVLMLTCLGIMGTTRGTVLFLWDAAGPQPGDGLYASWPERVYVLLGLCIGLVAGPVQAASRSLLIRLAPKEDIGQFFGLFALSGKVTSFIGPLLVAVATQAAASQRAGLVVLLAMFALGLALLAGGRLARTGSGGT